VAALQRAVALEQVDRIAVLVAEDLDLDVARLGEVFLDQHPAVAETRLASRWAACRAVKISSGLVDPAHALAAAAGARLDQDRIADLAGLDLQEPGSWVSR
jgi:hypothetical protein